MGELRDWSPESNGAYVEGRDISLPSSSSSSSNPSPASIDSERWRVAEEAAQGIISHIQPTAVSEERRRGVIDYVQRLIGGYIGCEVFPYGSVPLKTYLPDGDIDLTAFGVPNVVDSLANDVSSVLEGEEQNSDAEFVVKDVQVINAEVKLVKCLIQNIVVDISFNQLGGLCTLCFLEQVDRLIRKDHLFKRSIILIKAWCYYESRILGAHHSLISTYALETLVLYIFHLFHSSLNGPLEVLYRFLDYFSNFDWDNYCISVKGPVRLSLLPEIVVERPDDDGLDLLLSDEFLRNYVYKFSVPTRGHEVNSRTFLQKHFNIVDPLKENNNLGRSISKGNSYRIRSAFTYGARKLGHILLQPEENVADELRKFFLNTLDRHGSGQRPDVQECFQLSGFKGYGPVMSIEHCQEDTAVSISNSAHSGGLNGERRFDPDELLQNGVVDVEIMNMKVSNGTDDELQKEGVVSIAMSEAVCSTEGSAITGSHLSWDAKDLAKISNGNVDGKLAECSDGFDIKAFPGLVQAPAVKPCGLVGCSLDDDDLARNKEFLNSIGSNDSPILSSVASFSKDFYPGHPERVPTGRPKSPQAVKVISDLSGEYDSHLHGLQYGRWCYEYALSAPVSPMPLPWPSKFQRKSLWNSIRRVPQFRRGAFSHMSANGVVPRPAFFPINVPGSAFGMEDLPKARGTGTYFPNPQHQLNRERLSSARVRNHIAVRSPHNNGQAITSPEGNLLDRSSHEGSRAHSSVHQGGGNIGSSDFSHSVSPGGADHSNCKPNGLLLADEKVVEMGSFGQLQLGVPLEGSSRSTGTSVVQSSSPSPPSLGMQRTKPVLAANGDGVAIQLYHLKDEEDFPPLSA